MKKQITKKHPEGTLVIKISTDGTNPDNKYFSITGDIYEKDKPMTDRYFLCGGCIHDEILSICPELKPFVDLHLSTLDGVPMHAEENGWYWLAKAAGIPRKYEPEQDAETCFAYLLDHLRIDKLEGNKIMGEVATKYIDGKDELFFEEITSETRTKQEQQGIFRAKNEFKKIVYSMNPRWQDEAAKAIKQLEEI